jgi:hypothetical protein
VNVLFVDEYVEDFEATGASMSWVELEALNGATEVIFWQKVVEAYSNKENNRFNELLYDSLKFSRSLYVNHCASKLKEMGKSLNKHYNDARRRYQKSGNHDPNFFLAISKDGDYVDEIDDNF